MPRPLDTVLLLALPASGKSELRRYMASLDADTVRDDLHMGPTVQLDDYPYVHMMRRVSRELRERGHDGLFFDSDALPMKEPLDWGTLIELLNEDYEDLHGGRPARPASAGAWLMDRFDAARERVGAEPALGQLDAGLRRELEAALEDEATQLFDEKVAGIPDTLDGRTIVIEFARGGPEGHGFPLPHGFGYHYSLAQLSPRILSNASILYLWVTPEESRRKNEERARPDGDSSILHHGVPEAVMRNDYGTDDMHWLIEESRGGEDTLQVERDGERHTLPVARLDNRDDLTSFLRADPADWPKDKVAQLHRALAGAMATLAAKR